jgi:hypothetical protein
MPGPLVILQHTPPWVFGVFALLVVLGMQALRPRTVPIWRMTAIPLVFSAWGLITLASRSIESPVLFVAWVIAGAAGLLLAWRTVRLDRLAIDRHRGLVSIPGSRVPLARNLAIFGVKYVFTAAIAISPGHRASLLLCNFTVSGLMAGYFMGWLVRFAMKYRMAVEPEPVANS